MRRYPHKQRVHKLVHGLPESSSSEDIMYRLYVRQKIDIGLADIKAGRVHSHVVIRKQFGLI